MISPKKPLNRISTSWSKRTDLDQEKAFLLPPEFELKVIRRAVLKLVRANPIKRFYFILASYRLFFVRVIHSLKVIFDKFQYQILLSFSYCSQIVYLIKVRKSQNIIFHVVNSSKNLTIFFPISALKSGWINKYKHFITLITGYLTQ